MTMFLILRDLFTAFRAVREARAKHRKDARSERLKAARAVASWSLASDESVLSWATAAKPGAMGAYGYAQREADRRGLPWRQPRAVRATGS